MWHYKIFTLYMTFLIVRHVCNIVFNVDNVCNIVFLLIIQYDLFKLLCVIYLYIPIFRMFFFYQFYS